MRDNVIGIRKIHAFWHHASCTNSAFAMYDRRFTLVSTGCAGVRRVFGSSRAVNATQHFEHHGDARSVVVRPLVERRKTTQCDEKNGDGQEDKRNHAQQ